VESTVDENIGHFVRGVANSVPCASFGSVPGAKCDEKNGFVSHIFYTRDGNFAAILLFSRAEGI